mgnify:CR=1 FL=1
MRRSRLRRQRCPTRVNPTASSWFTMEHQLAAEFMNRMLAAHQAEDAFVPQPQDPDVDEDMDDDEVYDEE